MNQAVPTDWQAFDQRHIWHPFTPLETSAPPLCITHAKGALLHSSEGRSLIDGISSWWVNLHGHAHPRLAHALHEQAQQLEHVIFAGFTHPPAIRLGKALRSALPHHYERLFFSDNGSTAVEVALKLALQYHSNRKAPRTQIIALAGGYHGDTFGAMSLGGPGLFNRPFKEHMFEIVSLPFPSTEEQGAESHRLLKQAMRLRPTAAFVFEALIQAAGGMRTYASQWLDDAILACQHEGVLCVADEVFTGFGRTGKLFASHYLRKAPDLIALSKGLTGGMMPMGITAISAELCKAYQSADFEKTFFHGHSYTANPLACRVAEESLQMLQEKNTQAAIQSLCRAQKEFFCEIGKHPAVASSRSLGTIGALTLKSTASTGYDNPLRTRIYDYFLSRNILLRPLGNVLYVLPPYVISNAQLQQIYAAIRDFLDELMEPAT